MCRVKDVVAQLQRLGMPGYEAKAYVALVAAAEPLNGYEVAKRSGVPRSTIYETLAKLVARDVTFEVHSSDPDVVEYIPLPPATLFARLRDETEDAIEKAAAVMGRLNTRPTVRYTVTLPSRDDVRNRCIDVIASATKRLRLWVWPEDLVDLEPALRRAAASGVEVDIVGFGEPLPFGRYVPFAFATAEEVRQMLGCNLLIAVREDEEAIVAGLAGEDAWGIYTDDPAIVTLAREFIELQKGFQQFARFVGPEKVSEWRVSERVPSPRSPAVRLLRRLTESTESPA